MAANVGLFSCACHRVSSLAKRLFMYFVRVLTGLLAFLLLNFESFFLCILDTTSLPGMWFANIFPPSVACLFYLFKQGSSTEQNFLFGSSPIYNFF